MTALQLLTRADEAAMELLGVTSKADLATPPDGAKFDNRPTWDNGKSPKFDNRPTWDNWNKK
jgi:hypothetical protein